MSEEEETARLREAQIRLAVTAISAVVMLWYLMPEWQRKQFTMRVIAKIQTTLSSWARTSGYRAMRHELASGRQAYDVPYAWSVLRDRLATWYERARS